jgi:hypothetical protein
MALCTLFSPLERQAHAQPTTALTIAGDTEDDSSRLPWRGTSLGFSQSLNLNAISRSAQLSYNPTYSWLFVLAPRWYFSRTTFANIDQRLSLELTDSDSTLRSQRALLSDTIFGVDTQLFEHKFADISTLEVTGGAHLVAPTSLASQAATMTLGTRLRAGVGTTFPHVMKGLAVAVQGRYGHRFLRHNTVQTDAPFPCLSGAFNIQNCEFLGTSTNVTDSLSSIVQTSLALTDAFTVEMLVWLSWAHATDFPPVTVSGPGFETVVRDTSVTHWRNERYLVLGVNWTATDWLSIELSLIDYFPEKNLAGENRGIANPLDVMLGLTTSIVFDRLYLATLGRPTEPMKR